MSCRDPRGYSISKGQIYRLAYDLDGLPTEGRSGRTGETHYFVVLSHLAYNRKFSKKSFLAVGFTSNNDWYYSESLIPMEHFDQWDNYVTSHGYYSLFYKVAEVYFQPDKVVRLCQNDIEWNQNRQQVLSLSQAGMNIVIEKVISFIKIRNDDPN